MILEECRDSDKEAEGRMAFWVQRIECCRRRGVRGQLKLGETQAGKKQRNREVDWQGTVGSLPAMLLSCCEGCLTPRPRHTMQMQESLVSKHITEATVTQRAGGQQRSRWDPILAQEEARLHTP